MAPLAKTAFELMPDTDYHWTFTELGNERYLVHPVAQSGTCGFYPRAWNASIVTGLHKAAQLASYRTECWQAGREIY